MMMLTLKFLQLKLIVGFAKEFNHYFFQMLLESFRFFQVIEIFQVQKVLEFYPLLKFLEYFQVAEILESVQLYFRLFLEFFQWIAYNSKRNFYHFDWHHYVVYFNYQAYKQEKQGLCPSLKQII
jgi:hypothetical protein